MSRNSALILLGVLILLTPFSGLPTTMRTLLTVVFGATVLGIGVAERSRAQRAMLSTASSTKGDVIDTPEPSRGVSAI